LIVEMIEDIHHLFTVEQDEL